MLIEKNIARLQVSMYDAALVQHPKTVADGEQNANLQFHRDVDAFRASLLPLALLPVKHPFNRPAHLEAHHDAYGLIVGSGLERRRKSLR